MNLVKLHYSEALVRSAVKAFWLRVVGWRFLIVVLLLLVICASMVASGDRSWFVGALGAVIVLGLAMAAAVYVVHYRGSVGRFRRLTTPEGTFEPGDDGFRITSDAGLAEVRWTHVREIWRFPDFWLVLLSPAQFIMLPTADLDEATRAFLVARVQAHGGRVA